MNAGTFVTCPKISIKNSVLHSSVAKIKHIVGFSVRIKCAPKFYADGVSDQITCFAEGKYCASKDFGVKECASSEVPQCSPCPDGCSGCSGDGGQVCTDCVDDKLLINGECVEAKQVTSCKALYDSGKLKEGVSEVYVRDHDGGN